MKGGLWSLVGEMEKKNPPKLATMPTRSKMVRQSTKKPKPKVTKKKSHPIQAQEGIQAKAKEANNSE